MKVTTSGKDFRIKVLPEIYSSLIQGYPLIVNAIVAAGIDASRLSAAGYGQERPVADNRSEEGRAKNRRVELVEQP